MNPDLDTRTVINPRVRAHEIVTNSMIHEDEEKVIMLRKPNWTKRSLKLAG